MPEKYVKRILDARIYDVVVESPIDTMNLLSKKMSNEVLIKREDLQSVFSFKIRGALNKMSRLSDEERSRGVIAASAGNHAQGVALAARKLGIKARIVMPKTTPEIKVLSVREKGCQVILHGDTFDEAFALSQELAEKNRYTFIHPFDDPDVIAGQGTIAMEILRQVTGPLHAVFVPVGGGGLLAGMAAFIKYLRPAIKVIGVEAADSACLYEALKKGRRVVLPQVGIFADGVAVSQVGKEPFRIAKTCVDEVITVSIDEICAAIKDLFDNIRSIAEPAGALALAGLKKYVQREGITGETLLAIESGANVNFDRLRHVSERAELGEGREIILGVTIPEKPGSFKTFCKTLGRRNITEFNYRYSSDTTAQVFVGIQLSTDGPRKAEIIENLQTQNYEVVDLSDNELAKLHIRYMVGGHAPVNNEVIYCFEFPERPGALLNFLTRMVKTWNISMFHYRNHGAAHGRVFMGLQVPTGEKRAFKNFLKDLNYPYREECGNPAYKLFLG